ncbi:MAG: TIGR00282 family metallophosphoesterase [Flavobacteriaceae bacterium]
MSATRILFVGDVVGRSGREAAEAMLPDLIDRLAADLVILNGENAAGGFGITEAIFESFMDLGVDCVTLGNHSFDQKEALVFIERHEQLIRPINLPPGTPGRGVAMVEARNGARVLVINAMGRVFMQPIDDPFALVAEEIDACPLGEGADAIFVDFHAEATSEKQALAAHLDGRISALVGTHTHVPTADNRILPGGTGYMTDVGMTGDYDSIIGMDKEEPVSRFLTALPRRRFAAAEGPGALCGVLVEVEEASGLARAVSPVRLGEGVEETLPE